MLFRNRVNSPAAKVRACHDPLGEDLDARRRSRLLREDEALRDLFAAVARADRQTRLTLANSILMRLAEEAPDQARALGWELIARTDEVRDRNARTENNR